MKAPIPTQNTKKSDEAIEFGSGNAGNDVVIKIFERLHQTTGGAHSVRKGKNKSSRSKLRNLSTAPSEKILKQQMWKDFFGSTENADSNNNNNSYAGKEKRRQPDDSNDHVHDDRAEKELNYQRLYHRLVKRINHLWKELKVPLSDRDFYSVAIIKEKFQNVNQIDDLSCYVKRLLDHRKDIIQVIEAIKDREYIVEQCNSLLSVALRYYNIKYSTLHDDIARNIEKQEPHGIDKEKQLQHEIKSSLFKLQQVSCNVIKMIRSWREGLWRPQPFMYRGTNYLIKMNTDMNFLKSKSVHRILDSIPIEHQDLICVLFDTSEEKTAGSSGSMRNTDFEENGTTVLHVSTDYPLRGGELESSIE
jgi:hypothetical protein